MGHHAILYRRVQDRILLFVNNVPSPFMRTCFTLFQHYDSLFKCQSGFPVSDEKQWNHRTSHYMSLHIHVFFKPYHFQGFFFSFFIIKDLKKEKKYIYLTRSNQISLMNLNQIWTARSGTMQPRSTNEEPSERENAWACMDMYECVSIHTYYRLSFKQICHKTEGDSSCSTLNISVNSCNPWWQLNLTKWCQEKWIIKGTGLGLQITAMIHHK